MKKTQVIIFLLLSLIILSCDNCKKIKDDIKGKKIEIHLNSTIILDLSDRIIDEDQINRDTLLIAEIIKNFEEDFENGKIQIAIAPQKGGIISEIDRKNYEAKMSIEESDNEYDEKKIKLFETLKEVYSKANFSLNRNDYKGADIRQAFEDLRFETDTSNINNIFVLTDGYQYVSGSQAGLKGWLKLDKDLTNTKIMVLETNPVTVVGADEFKKIQKAWYYWLKQAKCESIFIEKNINIENVKETIKKFIVGEKSKPTEFDAVNINDSPGQVYSLPILPNKPLNIQSLSEKYKTDVQSLLKQYSNTVFENIRQNSSTNKILLRKENQEIDFNVFKQKLKNGDFKSRNVYHVGVSIGYKIISIEIE